MNYRIVASIVIAYLLIGSSSVYAAINNSGIFDTVLLQFSTAASTWAGIITTYATRLFWALVAISMVWTFGFMALRKADIGEFFAEFIRFTIFVGFFFWLLINGPAIADSIITSMRNLGGMATGVTGGGLTPSGIVDIGFAIFDLILDNSSGWSPIDSLIGILGGITILVVLALVSTNMLILLISAWILIYAGIFYLGFGGSRWTSDIAINYYKTVLGIAMQLLTMVLIVGIASSILSSYYASMTTTTIEYAELAVLIVVAIILLHLVNKVPPLISGVITGSSIGSGAGGGFGVGAAVGAAAAASGAAAVASTMVQNSAEQMAGGAKAVMAAVNMAQENVSNGTDVMSKILGRETESSVNSASSTPLAEVSGMSSFMKNTGRMVADTASNLAGEFGGMAKGAISEKASAASERVSDTVGGRIADSMIANSAFNEMKSSNSHTINQNSISNASGNEDLDSEVNEFSNKNHDQG